MPKADEPADFTSHHVLPVSVAETVGGQIKLDTTTPSIVHWRRGVIKREEERQGGTAPP